MPTFDRRRFIAASAAAAGALSSKAFAATPSSLTPETLAWSNFDGKAIRHLNKAAKIAIPTYRFGIVVRSGISATAVNVTSTASVDLVGVSLEMARAIADRAMEDFMSVAAASGRPVAGMDEIKASAGYAALKKTNVPWGKSPFADARLAVFVSPNNYDLFFTHFDSPMTDQSPFALDNWRALNRLSMDFNAVILLPTVVVDFAQLSGSGHTAVGIGASTSVTPGMYVIDMLTSLSAYHAKIAIAGELGKATLQRRVLIGQAGEFVQTSDVNNRAEVAWWNSDVARGAATPGTGPVSSYSDSTYEYRIEPELFQSTCFNGAAAVNRSFGEALAANMPR